MIKELVISKKGLDLIRREFETNKPYEACGVIIGVVSDTVVNVEDVIPIKSIVRTSISFELDPLQFYNAWNDADKNGKEIVGIYHTHPFHHAIPSSWDIDTMKNFSSVWLIAGIDGIFGYIYDDVIKNIKISINDM